MIYNSLTNIYSLFKFSGIADNIHNMNKYKDYDIKSIKSILERTRDALYTRYREDCIGVNNNPLDTNQFSSKYGRIIQWSIQNILDKIPNFNINYLVNYDVYINEVIDVVAKYLQIENFISKNDPGFNYIKLDFESFKKKIESMSSLFDKTQEEPEENNQFENGKRIATFEIETDEEVAKVDRYRGYVVDELSGSYAVTQITDPYTLKDLSQDTNWCTRSISQARHYLDANQCLYLIQGDNGDEYLYSPKSAIINDIADDPISGHMSKTLITNLVNTLLLSNDNPPLNTISHLLNTSIDSINSIKAEDLSGDKAKEVFVSFSSYVSAEKIATFISDYLITQDSRGDTPNLYNFHDNLRRINNIFSGENKTLIFKRIISDLNFKKENANDGFESMFNSIHKFLPNFIKKIENSSTPYSEEILNNCNILIDSLNELVLTSLESNSPNTISRGLILLNRYNFSTSKQDEQQENETPNDFNKRMGSPINYDLNNYIFRKISQSPRSINDFFNLIKSSKHGRGDYSGWYEPLLLKLSSSSKKIFLQTLDDIFNSPTDTLFNLFPDSNNAIFKQEQIEEIIKEKIIKNIEPYLNLIHSININDKLYRLIAHQLMDYLQSVSSSYEENEEENPEDKLEQKNNILEFLIGDFYLSAEFSKIITILLSPDYSVRTPIQIQNLINDYKAIEKESNPGTYKESIFTNLLKSKNYFGESGSKFENISTNVKQLINFAKSSDSFHYHYAPIQNQLIHSTKDHNINFLSMLTASAIDSKTLNGENKEIINNLLDIISISPESSFRFFMDTKSAHSYSRSFLEQENKIEIVESALSFRYLENYLASKGTEDSNCGFVDIDKLKIELLNQITRSFSVNDTPLILASISKLIEEFQQTDDDSVSSSYSEFNGEEDNDVYDEKIDLLKDNVENTTFHLADLIYTLSPNSPYYKANIQHLNNIFSLKKLPKRYDPNTFAINPDKLLSCFINVFENTNLVKDMVIRGDFLSKIHEDFKIDYNVSEQLLKSIESLLFDKKNELDRISTDEIDALIDILNGIDNGDNDFFYNVFNILLEITREFKEEIYKNLYKDDYKKNITQRINNFLNDPKRVFYKNILEKIENKYHFKQLFGQLRDDEDLINNVLFEAQEMNDEDNENQQFSLINKQSNEAYNKIKGTFETIINSIDYSFNHYDASVLFMNLISGNDWTFTSRSTIGAISDWVNLEILISKSSKILTTEHLLDIREIINATLATYNRLIEKMSQAYGFQGAPEYPVLVTIINMLEIINKELSSRPKTSSSIINLYRLFKK